MVLSIHDAGEGYDTARQSFIVISNDIAFDRRLGAAAVRAFLALSAYVDSRGICNPSQKALGDLLGVSARAVRREIVALTETGWVQPLPVLGPKGDRTGTKYRLIGVLASPQGGEDNRSSPPGQQVRRVRTTGPQGTSGPHVSDEAVMLASLEVTGPQPVTFSPEGPEVPPVPGPGTPDLVPPEVPPEVPPVPTPTAAVLGKGGAGGKPSFATQAADADANTVPPLAPLSADAQAFMEAHRAAFALRRPFFLNPSLRAELEAAVLDLGLPALLETLQNWAVLNDVRQVIKIIRGTRSKREGPEKRALDAKRSVLAVPKPGQNGRSGGMRQVSRQQYRVAHMVIADRLRGEEVPDSELSPEVQADIAQLEARGWKPGDPYD